MHKTGDFLQENKPLAAILCGFERGGTTVLSQILKEHPILDSAFEGGLLLGEKVADFSSIQPYCRNFQYSWELDDRAINYILKSSNWIEAYKRIVERSPAIENKDSWIFDKTPKYMQVLSQVMKKVPGVPCIVIVRDPRAVLSSWARRTQWSGEVWIKKNLEFSCKRYLSYARGFTKAIENGLGSKILLIRYEELCTNTVAEAEKIFDFLGLDFQESYLRFDRGSLSGNVYGKQLSSQYLNRYKNTFSPDVCNKIMRLTEECKEWFWQENDMETVVKEDFIMTQSTNLNSLIKEANQLKKEGDIEPAIAKYKEALQINANFVPALNQLAEIYQSQKKFDLAVDLGKLIIKVQPKNGLAHAKLAQSLVKNSRLEEGIALFQKAITLASNLPAWVYRELGEALKQDGKIEEAIAAYQKAIQLKPDFLNVYLFLAEIYFDKHEYDNQIDAYQKALNCYQKTNDKILEGQEKSRISYIICLHFKEMIQRKPEEKESTILNFIKLALEKAKQLADLDKLDRAIEINQLIIDINPQLALNPELIDCYFLLGNALSAKGQVQESELSNRMAISIAKNNTDRSESLENLVSQVSIQKTVVISFLSHLYFPMFEVWYSYFKKLDISNLIVVALDPIALSKLKKIGIVTYLLDVFSYQKSFNFKQMLWPERVKLLLEVNAMGTDLILTGVDVFWLKNPLKLINNLKADIAGLKGHLPAHIDKEWGFTINGDFYSIKASKNTGEFMKKYLQYAYNYSTDQTALNQVLLDCGTQWTQNKDGSHTGKSELLDITLCVPPEKLVGKAPKRLNKETYIFSPPLRHPTIQGKIEMLKSFGIAIGS